MLTVNQTTCLHCSAETTNGLALCKTCQYGVGLWLTYLPIHFRNLARQQRPGRPNGSLNASGGWLIRREEADPSLIPVALDRALKDITTWALVVVEAKHLELPDGDTEAETMAAFCDLLAEHLTVVATMPTAGRFVRDVGRHEHALSKLTETAVPGWYAGECRQVDGRTGEVCGTPTYVVPGVTWVVCSGCGATTSAREHLPVVLEEAGDWLAPPMALAAMIVALVDAEVSIPRLHKRISKWGERGDITAVRRTARDYAWNPDLERIEVTDQQVGRARYRLGEALDLLHRRGPTRTTPHARTVAS